MKGPALCTSKTGVAKSHVPPPASLLRQAPVRTCDTAPKSFCLPHPCGGRAKTARPRRFPACRSGIVRVAARGQDCGSSSAHPMDFSTARRQPPWVASISSAGSPARRSVSASHSVGQLGERRPHPFGQPGHGGRAERGRLERARPGHRACGSGRPAAGGGGPWRRRPRRPAARTVGGTRRRPWHRSCRAPGRPSPPRRPGPAGPVRRRG